MGSILLSQFMTCEVTKILLDSQSPCKTIRHKAMINNTCTFFNLLISVRLDITCWTGKLSLNVRATVLTWNHEREKRRALITGSWENKDKTVR